MELAPLHLAQAGLAVVVVVSMPNPHQRLPTQELSAEERVAVVKLMEAGLAAAVAC
ncbi:hypothetical protein [Acidithiobacillus sp.]